MKSENKTSLFTDVQNDRVRNDVGVTQFFTTDKGYKNKLPSNDPILCFDNCLVDHSGRQFACIHEHCHDSTSCFRNEILDENIDFHALRFHPEDRTLWCEETFPDIVRFVNSIATEQLCDYRFLFNHRYIRKNGNISQFLHEGFITLSDNESIPLLKLKLFTEIGDFKTDETMVLSIFRYSADLGYEKVFTKGYVKNGISLISHREMEIIKLCLEGLSSKMIADKLNLSIHTVKNHKRNCMEKTLTHNITELINLCIRSHWL